MKDILSRAKDLSEDLGKLYGVNFEFSVLNLRNYITSLVSGIISRENEKKYLILEEIYDNKPKLFEKFLGEINIEKKGTAIDFVEEKIKKIS